MSGTNDTPKPNSGFGDEISIGGGYLPQSSDPNKKNNSDQSDHVHNEDGSCCGLPNMMTARKNDLESKFAPGVSNTDILDAILQLPTEQLIPWETCKLPSLGQYYGWPTSTVEVRAMGQQADKILATQRLAQTGESIDYLLKEQVRFPVPDFDPMDLLSGDRVFLLYYLRGITHSNIYEFALTCQNPECQKPATYSYDLNEIARTIRWAKPEIGQEPFKVTLPYISSCVNKDVWVSLRFLRGRDTNNMLAMRRTKKKAFVGQAVRAGRTVSPQERFRSRQVEIDDTLTENLELMIHDVMGDRNPMKIKSFVNRLHASDTATIREWLRDNSPGIETIVSLNCPECGTEFTMELPITESFFRPTQTR